MKGLIGLYKRYREIIDYLICGTATTFVNWILYAICISFWPGALTFCNALAWLGSVLFAYVVNKVFVFQSRQTGAPAIVKELALFFTSRGLTGVIEIFLPGFLFRMGMDQELFGLEGFFAKIVVSIIVIVSNFILSKFWVFKNKDTSSRSPETEGGNAS